MRSYLLYFFFYSFTFLLVDQALPQPLASDFSVATPSTLYVCRYNEIEELELFARSSQRDGLWDTIDYNLELSSLRNKRNTWRKRFASRKAKLGVTANKTRRARRRWRSYKRIVRALTQCGQSAFSAAPSDPCLEIAPLSREGGASQGGDSGRALPLVDDPSSTELSLRIINGSRCEPENSSVVKLEMVSSFSSSSCSGTVLNEYTVLTAAHCLDSRPRRVRVYAGSQIVEADGYLVHPDYNPFAFFSIESFDVAIIKVNTPLRAPTSRLVQGAVITGEASIAAGYGLDERGQYGRLKATTLEVSFVDFDTIATQFDGRVNNGNTCSGDSGGPLFVRRQGEWVVGGIVSNGDLQRCGVGDVSRYTNIDNPSVRSFIDANIGDTLGF